MMRHLKAALLMVGPALAILGLTALFHIATK
jgi:hypothetical protein